MRPIPPKKRGQMPEYHRQKISAALLGRPKTPEHNAKVSAALRTRKERPCCVCDKMFYPPTSFSKYCSKTCWNVRVSHKKPPELTCAHCHTVFSGTPYSAHIQKYCTRRCQFDALAQERMGENNPSYRNGFAVFGKRTYTGKHLAACSKYRKAFLAKWGYPFCEVCGVNQNGTQKFEVHHIYFASLYPKHPNLHDFRNLIHICIRCHNDFHSNKLSGVFIKLEAERGLKELFR